MRSLFAGIVTGLILSLSLILGTTPACPTEDSCETDYHHGRYHVVEVTP